MRCWVHSGGLRNEPRIDRKLSATEAVETKRFLALAAVSPSKSVYRNLRTGNLNGMTFEFAWKVRTPGDSVGGAEKRLGGQNSNSWTARIVRDSGSVNSTNAPRGPRWIPRNSPPATRITSA